MFTREEDLLFASHWLNRWIRGREFPLKLPRRYLETWYLVLGGGGVGRRSVCPRVFAWGSKDEIKAGVQLFNSAIKAHLVGPAASSAALWHIDTAPCSLCWPSHCVDTMQWLGNRHWSNLRTSCTYSPWLFHATSILKLMPSALKHEGAAVTFEVNTEGLELLLSSQKACLYNYKYEHI